VLEISWKNNLLKQLKIVNFKRAGAAVQRLYQWLRRSIPINEGVVAFIPAHDTLVLPRLKNIECFLNEIVNWTLIELPLFFLVCWKTNIQVISIDLQFSTWSNSRLLFLFYLEFIGVIEFDWGWLYVLFHKGLILLLLVHFKWE